MNGDRLSVIIVSRHRAEALKLCLLSLSMQDLPAFQVVVVADPAAIATLGKWSDHVTAAPFDEANISAARNLGLSLATGDVVAFIDDDAVAEPTWARRLLGAFARHDVVAATGFVRGRNGVSLQWGAAEVDARGQDHPLKVSGDGPSHPTPSPGRAVKTVGTNCAFRAVILRGIGGFDPALRFYLDDADVNLRLAAAGVTAVVPGAQVQHGFAPSVRRRADRAPTSLYDIAASTAVFLRRHAPATLDEGLALARRQQERRLLAMMVDGRLEPGQLRPLRQSLDDGWQDGLSRPLPVLAAIAGPSGAGARDFCSAGPRPGEVFAGRPWQCRKLEEKAREARRQGRIATVICLSPSFRPHWQRFRPDGIWTIKGGIWGKADRTRPMPVISSFSTRIAAILHAVSRYRPI
jgi:GT2 family glycosyltransferase